MPLINRRDILPSGFTSAYPEPYQLYSPNPTILDIAVAAFADQNSVVRGFNFLSGEDYPEYLKEDKDRDTFDVRSLFDTPYEVYFDDFIDITTVEEAERKKKHIIEELEASEVLSKRWALGFIASAVAQGLDPVNWTIAASMSSLGVVGTLGKWLANTNPIIAGATKSAIVAAPFLLVGEGIALNYSHTRTIQQAGMNIGVGVLFGGLLGGAGVVSRLGSAKSYKSLVKRFGRDLKRPASVVGEATSGIKVDPKTGKVITVEGAVSNAPDTTLPTSKDVGNAFGMNIDAPGWSQVLALVALKTLGKLTPSTRVVASPFISAQKAIIKMVPLSFLQEGNYHGIATDAPAYIQIIAQERIFLTKLRSTVKGGFKKYKKSGGDLSFKDFNAAVAKANHQGDVHNIPEVQEVAQHIRKNYADTILGLAKEEGVIVETSHNGGAKTYFPNKRDHRKARANPEAARKWATAEVQHEKTILTEKVGKTKKNITRHKALMDKTKSRLETTKQRKTTKETKETESFDKTIRTGERQQVTKQRIKTELKTDRTSKLKERVKKTDIKIDKHAATQKKHNKKLDTINDKLKKVTAKDKSLKEKLVKQKENKNKLKAEKLKKKLDLTEKQIESNKKHKARLETREAKMNKKIDRIEKLREKQTKAKKKLEKSITTKDKRKEAFLTKEKEKLEKLEKRKTGLKQKLTAQESAERIKKLESRLKKSEEQIKANDLELKELELDLNDLSGDGFDRQVLEVVNQLQSESWDTGRRNSSDIKITIRGSQKSRRTMFDRDGYIDFINTDALSVWEKWGKETIADIVLQQEFGVHTDFLTSDLAKQIKNEAAELALLNPEKQQWIMREMERNLRDLSAQFDRIRGVYNMKSNGPDSFITRGLSVARAWNVIRALGMMTFSSLHDIAAIIHTSGIKGFMKGSLGVLADPKGYKLSLKEAKWLSVIVDTQVSNHLPRDMSQIVDPYAQGGRLNSMLGSLQDKMSHYSGIEFFDSVRRRINVMAIQQQILTGAELASKGKLTNKQASYLASIGLDRTSLNSINASKKKFGGETNLYKLAGVDKWTDKRLVDKFRLALTAGEHKVELNPSILEQPLFYSSNVGKTILQFSSWTNTATQKLLIAGAQRGDINTMAGILSMVGIAMMGRRLKEVIKGVEDEDKENTDQLLVGALFDSGTLGSLGMISERFGRFAGGLPGYWLAGNSREDRAPDPLRNTIQLLGASASLGVDLMSTSKLLTESGRENFSEADLRALYRLAPFRTLIGLRMGYDYLQEATAEKILR